MPSSENKPPSSHRSIGAKTSNLTLNTSIYGIGLAPGYPKLESKTPPRTPKSRNGSRTSTMTKAEGRRLQSQAGRDENRETFLDDITPTVDSRNNAERLSHDLSMPGEQGTRDSLVENMLFSLNGSEGVFGGFGNTSADEARLYGSFADGLGMHGYRYGGGNRGNGHGHSMSNSEYEEERPGSRYTMTRERRSVSSGAFTMTQAQRAGGSNTLPRQAGKGSKGSGGSFDMGYAQITGNQRWAQGYAGGRRRSTSLEGYDHDTVLQNLARQQAARQKDLEPFDAYEAAPTPTVPREPRRLDTATARPESPMYLHSPVKEMGRKRSVSHNKNDRNGTAYGKRAEALDGQRNGNGNGNLPDQNRRLPPLPAFKQESNPKGKNSMPPPEKPAQKQEKQGFFRRVFGSNRNLNAALTQSETQSSLSSTPSRESTPISKLEPRPEGTRNGSYRSATSHGHPAPSPQPTAKEVYHQQPALKKTPSSFFRRRKKSVSEMAPPPMPLPPKPLDIDKMGRLDSPTGSLMNAMKPYMDSPTRPSALNGRYVPKDADSDEEEHREDMRSFSPQWNPDKSATIRSVDRDSPRDITQAFPASALGRDVEKVTDEDLDRSFLHDGSGNELNSPIAEKSSINSRVVSQSLTVKPDPIDRAQSPALSSLSKQESQIARDRQMVQEYNDKYAKMPVRKDTGTTLSLYPTNSNSIGPGSPQSARSSQRAVDEVVEKLEMGEELGDLEADEVVIVTPKMEVKKSERISLDPTLSEENMAKLRPKIDTTIASRDRTGTVESSQSTPNAWYSATELPLHGSDSVAQTPSSPAPPTININENSVPRRKSGEKDVVLEPTTEDRDRAKKIYDGNEDFILKSKAAAWIGEDSPARSRTLHAYMSLYDFKDMNILSGLRALCNRLVLRAESQQVDRILASFAKRWCECNPNHGFRSWDVVHTVCYSLLLLNTDLHVADIENKMTKVQFVKNALPTILAVVEETEGKEADLKESKRPSILVDTFKAPEDDDAKIEDKAEPASRDRGNSLEIGRGEQKSWRLSLRPGATRTNSDGPGASTPLQYSTGGDDSGPLVKAPFHGTLRTWEVQIEIVLKDFYNGIKAESLPLFDAENQVRPAALSNRSQQGQSTLSVFGTGMLRRTPSVISKAGSESGYPRGRTAEPRLNTGKWSTKNSRNRSRVGGGGSVYPSSLMGGSRTSLDDNSSSIWSPGGLSSSTSGWGGSKYSLAKANTSLSVNSFGSGENGDYHQSIGFANALSNAIIKEEYPQSRDGADSRSVMSGRTGISSTKGAKLLDDESLELEGAPWGKEGILKHKWHLDAEGKRSKERSWNEVFAVINQGYMSLFSFNSSSKSQRLKKSKTMGRGQVVGGGNWQDNAESLGQFVLRQTIASALPAPGYSKQRPYVFALSLPTGAVHLFQVGTETIIKEWVMTANYWSARLSNHPLVGGISNIEYGWGDAVINTSAMAAITESNSNDGVSRPPVSSENGKATNTGRGSISGARPSIQGSLRSSLDHASGGQFRARLPADKITISDWTPPTQSMRASTLSEGEQLAYLTDYVNSVEEDLSKHQIVRHGMGLAFSKSSPNALKATANWEKKSSYLLREIVKFRTYIDTLEAAKKRRAEVYEERREREMLREEHGN